MTRSGTMLSRLLTIWGLGLPTMALAQVPPNDECVTAIPILCGDTIAGTTTGAFPDEALTCGTTITAPGVWYVLQGMNAPVSVATCVANSYDTKLNVYQGQCGTITCVGGNDDAPGCGLGSRVNFIALSGVDYYILVQGYNNAVGDFILTVACDPVPNDECSGAIPIACGEAIGGTTVGAFPDEAATCGTTITAPGVWYTASGLNGPVTVSTCTAFSYDTKLNVYSGECGPLECVGGNDDTPGQGLCSTVNFNADPGETYQILVQGYNGATGTFTLTLECTICPAPEALAVTPLDVQASVQWQSVNPGDGFTLEYGPLGFTQGTGTAITGTVGVDGPPVVIGGLLPGTTYQIFLQETCTEGPGPLQGPLAFTTLSDPLAPNALCQGALPITCGAQVQGHTPDGLFTPAPHCGSAGVTTKGLWYGFFGTGSEVELSTCGTAGFDTKISVFAGTCTGLVCAAGNDDTPGCGGNTSRVTLLTEEGTYYLVLVHGYSQSQGTFTLTMTCTRPCSPAIENDICASAQPLDLVPPGACEPVTGTTVCAYAPPMPAPACNPFGNIADTWYVFNTGWSMSQTLHLAGLGNTVVNAALYTACGQQTYLGCTMNVGAPIVLTDLPFNTDILVRVWNGGGPQAGAFTICVTGDISTSVSEPGDTQAVRLRPVPTHAMLHVDHLPPMPTVLISDLTGRTVSTHPAMQRGTLSLPVVHLAPGVYLLRRGDDGGLIGRFVRE